MNCTFLHFLEGKETKYQELEKTKEDNMVLFFTPRRMGFGYEEVTHWFPQLIKRFPMIQFMYRHTVGKNDSIGRETIHVVYQKEGSYYSVEATVQKQNQFISPRLTITKLNECFDDVESLPISMNDEMVSAFLEEIPSVSRYKFCKQDDSFYGNESITFNQWKQQFKERKTPWEIQKETDEFFEMVLGDNCQSTVSLCKESTQAFQEKTKKETIIFRYEAREGMEVTLETFRLPFYHKNQLMLAEITIQEDNKWKDLRVDVNYARDGWVKEEVYREDDLEELKNLFLDLVKEEKSIRLHFLTGLIKECKKG